jgi:hypothetical protein
MIVSRELSRYRFHLVGVHEVRWEGSGTAPAGEYTFFRKGNENHELGKGFLYIRKTSAIKRVEVFSDNVSYIVLRGRWFHIIIENVHDPNRG